MNTHKWRPGFGWHALMAALLVCGTTVTRGQTVSEMGETSANSVPDIRGQELPVTASKGNFVAVPIPFSNPTIDSGLVGAVGYFHSQTEEQASTQPASVTGFGALYSSNKSYGIAVGHQGYWKEDRWRFAGFVAYANVKLPLLSIGQDSGILQVDWLLDGTITYAELSRRAGRHWYIGISGLFSNLDQVFPVDILGFNFEFHDKLKTSGMGLSFSYDTRDMPTNAYDGRYLKISGMSNGGSFGGDVAYQSYSVKLKSYHSLTDSFVLAWELSACDRSSGAPLWDACGIGLRGFSATDYLGKSSVVGQVEGRWHLTERWGVVAFAGGGEITETLTGFGENDVVPSYGVGLRFTVSPAHRINMRLDYGRSRDSDAVYLSVLEAF